MTDPTPKESPFVMSTDRLLNILFGILLGGMAWFLLTVYNDEQATKVDLNALALHSSQEFVRRDDLSEVKASLLRIEEKLDSKVDKTR